MRRIIIELCMVCTLSFALIVVFASFDWHVFLGMLPLMTGSLMVLGDK